MIGMDTMVEKTEEKANYKMHGGQFMTNMARRSVSHEEVVSIVHGNVRKKGATTRGWLP